MIQTYLKWSVQAYKYSHFLWDSRKRYIETIVFHRCIYHLSLCLWHYVSMNTEIWWHCSNRNTFCTFKHPGKVYSQQLQLFHQACIYWKLCEYSHTEIVLPTFLTFFETRQKRSSSLILLATANVASNVLCSVLTGPNYGP